MKSVVSRFRRLHLLFLFIIPPILIAGYRTKAVFNEVEGPTEPKDALATFRVEPGFKIELLANEPLIASPVDMEIDEYGRLYVVEMPGYPLDKSGTGRIKLLTDTDGDGQMDKSTIFADGLTLPNGILRWKKGIMITDAPNVLYLEDTDGDGRADKRDTLLTGFSLSNPHVNVNNPVYGLDNWVYLSHLGAIGTRKYGTEFGDKGSQIHFPDQPNAVHLPKNADGNSVRFRPESHALEMLSSKSQFGHTFDQWGHHFLTHNSNHVYAEVMAAAYVKRNPDLLITDAVQSISDHGHATEVFQVTKNPDRQLFTPTGVTTSSSGMTAYLGGAFPAPFDGNVTFVAESVSNLVHVDILKDQGATFVAGRHHTDKEFLASTDSWSRPVNMYVGPDGALYVLDYYRQIIEHPEWMSDEAVAAGGLYNGYNRGRIYRITPVNAKKADWTQGLTLGDASTAELVEKLSNPNNWWRLNAQRLLVDRADKKAVPDLVKMARNPVSPLGRLHALWTLEGLKALQPDLIEGALKDPVAGVRENAIRLAELHLADLPALATALLPLQTDADPKVRFQLLCTLGFINTPVAAQARQNLLFKDINDPWVQVAALSAASTQTAALMAFLQTNFKKDNAAYTALVKQLATMQVAGAGDNPAVIQTLIRKTVGAASTRQSGWEAPVLTGLTNGLTRKPNLALALQTEQQQLVKTCFESPTASVRTAAQELLKVIGLSDESLAKTSIARAVAIAGNRKLPNEKREEAIKFIALRNPAPHASLLKQLIVPQEQPAIQRAALKVLGLIPDQTATQYALQRWPALTPDVREVALTAFMANTERISALLDAIEAGKIQKTSVGLSRSYQLMGLPQAALREKARALLDKTGDQKVNEQYKQALELKGDEAKGRVVYQQNCMVCHKHKSETGVAYGPDLGTVHNWLAKDIMANVLDPNLSIAPGFDLWAVELKNGESLQGMILNETSAAITLRTAPGLGKTISRQDIKSLQMLEGSLMPSFAGQIDQQQMADLLAFLRHIN